MVLDEKELHINILELIAILFSLQAFERELDGRHVRGFYDNNIGADSHFILVPRI